MLVSSFTSAWNQHDAHLFAESFAEDADFTNVIGLGGHGRSAIEQFHAPVFETIFKQSHLSVTDIRTRFVSPDIASVDVRWEMTGATERDGTDSTPKGVIELARHKERRRVVDHGHAQSGTYPAKRLKITGFSWRTPHFLSDFVASDFSVVCQTMKPLVEFTTKAGLKF